MCMKKRSIIWLIIAAFIVIYVIFLYRMMNNNAVSWADLFIEIFASFMGFGLALVADELSDNAKLSSDRDQLIANIRDELIMTQNTVDNLDVSLFWINPIKIPYLKSSLQTQKIALLCDKPYDIIHKHLLELDDLVEDYNAWHGLITQSAVINGVQIELSNKIEDLKKELINKIDLVISELNEFVK